MADQGAAGGRTAQSWASVVPGAQGRTRGKGRGPPAGGSAIEGPGRSAQESRGVGSTEKHDSHSPCLSGICSVQTWLAVATEEVIPSSELQEVGGRGSGEGGGARDSSRGKQTAEG